MRTKIYWIPEISCGRLGLAPRPRGGDWLEDEINGWRMAGVNTVVSLLTDNEVYELNLEKEKSFCSSEGIDFFSIPIPDRDVPKSSKSIQKQIRTLSDDLGSGKHIVAHCRQGIGRASLIIALIMMQQGIDPDDALQRIENARGRPVPDTIEQRKWLRKFAAAKAITSQRSVGDYVSHHH